MAYFYVTITGNFGVFDTQTLKQIFWKKKTFFKKPDYRFLTESTKIENATFPLKTGLSEANFKTNRMGSTKWTYYHKEWSFASNSFILFFFLEKFCFSLRTSYKELVRCTNSQISIFILLVSPGVLLGGVFSLWVTLNTKVKGILVITCVLLLYHYWRFGYYWGFIDTFSRKIKDYIMEL